MSGDMMSLQVMLISALAAMDAAQTAEETIAGIDAMIECLRRARDVLTGGGKDEQNGGN